jgi:phosphoribosylformylglycinamidine cyclo-ligase
MDYQKEIVDPGDMVSRLAHQMCVESRDNSPAVRILSPKGEHFRGLVSFRWKPHILKGMMDDLLSEVPQSDGAGGKPQFFTLLDEADAFRGLGWELITMNADDLAAGGALPVFMLASNIDVRRIIPENFPLIEAMLKGFGVALKQAGLVLMTGETAVMKHSITAFCDDGTPEQLVLTWSGTCLGLKHEHVCVDGSQIEPGMAVVGFLEKGYRCNGGTIFTELVKEKWGAYPGTVLNNAEAVSFVRALTVPSRSYAKTFARLIGWQPSGELKREGRPPIFGIAHITGGGVWNKFGELLPVGIGADLDRMPAPPDVLLQAQFLSQELSGVCCSGVKRMSDEDCYGSFHGGCGALLVCRECDTDIVIREAQIDGHDALVVGHTTNTEELCIHSRFLDQKHLCRSLSSG